ncbi:nitrous oxide reductase accessory protein NosL [Hydrogenimonas thermophila]|uniref:nitrous oxide reductase accessory protein NosL n=1 Tax=Hydrogenimonas thermophila TaxID=223786 RepID=UPI002936E18C|nr:nitrous oxide reductase accessory protein NosL [Hydrogenimonas thermophila]WOE70810.1 nitrous oxide reductase accessory protein NosL [Hydrogenimonas thermophila]WOE73328.1 nitrous oxide reductase accessory protein NosL [Hydrogenimonas thermophila]
MRQFFLILLFMFSVTYATENHKVSELNKLDPAYKIEINKYPKFEARIVLKNGNEIRFCCVKSMFHFYYKPSDFPEYGIKDREEIDKIVVKDYLDGSYIDAKKAWYVFGSRLMGPHGDDLIPLSSKTKAELFMKRYGGTVIMDYKTVDQKGYGLIKYLDM